MKRLIFAATALAILSPDHATADTAEACAAIENPDARLSCYDALFVERETPVFQDDWQVEIETSALDDSQRVILSLSSEAPVRARFGEPQRASLFIRCEENTTSFFVHFAGNFMSDNRGGGRIDYRIDDNSPAYVNARESNNNMALGLWRGSSAIPFIRGLFGGSSLYLRATPFSESRIEMSFNITGLEDAIIPLREACNW